MAFIPAITIHSIYVKLVISNQTLRNMSHLYLRSSDYILEKYLDRKKGNRSLLEKRKKMLPTSYFSLELFSPTQRQNLQWQVSPFLRETQAGSSQKLEKTMFFCSLEHQLWICGWTCPLLPSSSQHSGHLTCPSSSPEGAGSWCHLTVGRSATPHWCHHVWPAPLECLFPCSPAGDRLVKCTHWEEG